MFWKLKIKCVVLFVKFYVFIVCFIKVVGLLIKDNGLRKLLILIFVRNEVKCIVLDEFLWELLDIGIII